MYIYLDHYKIKGLCSFITWRRNIIYLKHRTFSISVFKNIVWYLLLINFIIYMNIFIIPIL